jgi:4-carboxymuconolactone decarboxylase
MSKSALPAEHQHAADAVLEVFGHIRGPFSMLLHSPELARQLLPMVTFVRQNNVIEPSVRFAAILTSAREHEARYVWAAQVEQARKNGIREALIDLVRSRAESSRFDGEERTAVEYVRQLVNKHRVDDATFAALRDKHDPKWMVELTAVVSFFGFVSQVCNAMEVEPPEGLDRF